MIFRKHILIKKKHNFNISKLKKINTLLYTQQKKNFETKKSTKKSLLYIKKKGILKINLYHKN